MELLLVIAVMGIASAVVVPQFYRSMRGNRLRSAARSVIMSGRFARSMALLKQQVMVVEFNTASGEITVRPAQVGTNAAAATTGADRNVGPSTAGEMSSEPTVLTDEMSNEAATGTGKTELKRRLDRVTFESIEIDGAPAIAEDGLATVRYGTNGRCTPYEVVIKDEFNAAVRVKVDNLAGIRTERLEL